MHGHKQMVFEETRPRKQTPLVWEFTIENSFKIWLHIILGLFLQFPK